MSDFPKLYGELAAWFPLLSKPEDYAEEAEFAAKVFAENADSPIRTLLELGAGGGNNAMHLKATFQMTLTDLSAEMLENSRKINPECEHIVGDMRTLRLGRVFDGVFIHDAIVYMLTEPDLSAAIETAVAHCRDGGVVLIMPDCVRETLQSGVLHHGGTDAGDRSLRHLQWTFDPNPDDTTYTVDFVYMLREGGAPVRVVHDIHTAGVFPRETWLRLMRARGLSKVRQLEDDWGREVFVGVK